METHGRFAIVIVDLIDNPYNRKAEDGLPGSSCKQVSKEVE